MKRTMPPAYNQQATNDWRRKWAGKPLRLELTCRRDGHAPWTVIRDDIEITPLPAAAHSPAPVAPNGLFGRPQRLNI